MSATEAPEAEARPSLTVDESVASALPPQTPPDDALQCELLTKSKDDPAQADSTTSIKAEDVTGAVAGESGENSTTSTLRPTPLPSAKRRESEAAVSTPDDATERPSKKRKRGPSPPWQFPTAETSTLKTADGRRVSARVNLSTPSLSENEGRGRSPSLSQSARSRQVSPPWKKFEAQGPSAIQVDGVRKSGRVNKDLAEGPKRVSPRTKKKAGRLSSDAQDGETKTTPSKKNNTAKTRKSDTDLSNMANGAIRPASSGANRESTSASTKIAELKAQIAALKPSRSFPSPASERPQSSSSRKHARQNSGAKTSTTTSPSKPRKTKTSTPMSPPQPRKKHRASNPPLSPDIPRPSPKITLRNTNVRLIAAPHPHASIPPPAHPPQLSLYQIIDGFELQEMQLPFLENERGVPEPEFFEQRSTRQAAEEGAMRRRLIQETRPGGALSREKLSLFADERQPEPPPHYGHADHLVAHAVYLRQLQQREKLQHRTLAKKLAHEAVEYWKALNGPTEEDLIVEQQKILELIKKQVVADMKAKWEMVEAHVQAAKKVDYEAEQEVKRLEKLEKQLQRSEDLLAKQRRKADSDVDMDNEEDGLTDDEDDDDGEASGTSSEEDMSESGSEADEGPQDMSKDELDRYLAQRDVVPPDDDGEPRESGSEDDGDFEEDYAEQDEDHGENMPDAASTSLEHKRQGIGQPSVGGEAAEEEMQDTHGYDSGQADDVGDRVTRGQGHGSRSASPMDAGAEVEQHLSSDESTDMDSESDVSDSDSAGSESADDDGPGVYQNFLMDTLNLPDPPADNTLLTPSTSVENGGYNNVRSHSVATSDSQARPSAADGSEEVPAKVETTNDQAKSQDHIGSIDEELKPAINSTGEDIGEEDIPVTQASRAVSETPGKGLVPQPSLLRGTLRSYQHAGLDWLASLYRNRTNGILADEMGLGKTIQTIALLAHLAEVHEVWEPHLIIVPTSVILNWVVEFQKFLPGFRVLGYYGTAEERAAKRRAWSADPHHEDKDSRGYNVVVTSYQIAVQDIGALRVVHWHYLILDEAHTIRNFQSIKWQRLIRLRTRARLLLTGTPLQNSLTELWALLTFLAAGDDEGGHGELEEFISHWKTPVDEIFHQGLQKISEDSQKVVNQLHISLRPFLLRRKKSEVEKDLPKKIESVVVCKLSKRQRQLYQEYMGLTEIRAALARGSGVQAGAVLLSLRKVCNHPDLFDPRPIQTSFAMERSPLEGYSVKEQLVRRMLGIEDEISAKYLPVRNEGLRKAAVQRSRRLAASNVLRRQLDEMKATSADSPDTATIAGSRALQRLRQKARETEHMNACIQLTDAALRDAPVYGCDLRELVCVRRDRLYVFGVHGEPNTKCLQLWPALGQRPLRLDHPGDRTLVQSTRLQQDIATFDSMAEKLQDTIVRFAFVPPAVTVPILNFAIPHRIQEAFRSLQEYSPDRDYAHEARVRTSIAFPDSRLLIYDSGKLQRLSYLLRDLQARGSRSLIFTQMTGTLNILERFLSLMSLPYLRLDGSTPIEQRQLYSSEFNRPDSKYQCMILSSRAGGVGLNLTGASSVIFYDLDWNPQMDRQCMDRAHRIGQMRDVEVYKMVSEKTVEENILRRANQKSLLDQTIIQEGQFTTEYPLPTHCAEETGGERNPDSVDAAIARLYGDSEKDAIKALESVEDKDDVLAAQAARKEAQQDDIVDFADRQTSKGPSKANSPGPGGVAVEEAVAADERHGHVDLYMIKWMEALLKHVRYVPPAMRKPDKHGRDRSHRPRKR